MIATVIPEKRTNPEKEIFSYNIPESLKDRIDTGSIVQIPFGKYKIRGVIKSKEIKEISKENNFQLKEIISVDEQILPKQYLNIAQWISEYYLCSLGEAISLFLPPKVTRPRKTLAVPHPLIPNSISLNKEQQEILDKLKALLDKPKIPALLHGVTGSGKTEVYLKLTEETLRLDKQVIVLVPEIMLTTQIIELFQKRFGDKICLMHSNLSASQRYSNYMQFAMGDKQIIIGPRSALLVPSKKLGLIIIDEEQEDAYKQEKSPRYMAVDLAQKIAKESDALLLLGSATPRIESYYKCKNSQEYELLELKNRYHKMILPPCKIVDLKNEIKYNNYSPISTKLQDELAAVLKAKKQAILFINRRGAATFVSCRDCGHVLLCPRCSIPMVHHIHSNTDFLNCHHCDYKAKTPKICPSCNGVKIKFFGSGIEKIEIEIRKLFPKANIRRIDSKSLENKGEYENLYKDLCNQKIDILIGTQIVAKGLDLPEVDLVGVVSADTGLHMPHFRANEKTFQILTQVSGRSGRKNNCGKTIIQTYWPESRAIKFASLHDYEGFFNEEISDRKEHDYPPFKKIIRIISEDKIQTKAKEELKKIAHLLEKENVDFIGPAPCFLSRINDKFRYHIIIKTNSWPSNRIREIFYTNPYLIWDVEPTNLL